MVLEIISGILPLYLIIGIGYASGKLFEIDTKSIATITVFVVSPIVFILSISKISFSGIAVIAPFITLFFALCFSFLVLNITKLYMKDGKTPYLSALMSGTGNWGYLGIPIAFTIFDQSVVGLYIAIGVGMQIFENSLGIYFISRGNSSPIQSLKNIFRYPVLYAMVIGFVLSYFEYTIPVLNDQFFDFFKGAYTVLGMMIIGLGLADMHRFRIDIPFTFTVLVVQFVLWPLAAFLIIWLDKNFLHFFGESFYGPILLFSLMPMAANNAAFAAKFDMFPGKASVGILASTLFAIIYIPCMIYIFIS